MLAHVVVTYDVKLEDNVTFPPSLHIGTFTTPNPHAKVVFRTFVLSLLMNPFARHRRVPKSCPIAQIASLPRVPGERDSKGTVVA
ncbi:hypothetical protein L210DRAFT_2096904 [Boletus edulis BED1]|uniref:Uncharacterized protein n=1 Tax=Boletus edulis BED1 TaxID=1328754 RepID=A0AAD4BFC7_BOLED|nr:hypothetical protein L210DRAFT_2096904 [Boletus edulis BED1]